MRETSLDYAVVDKDELRGSEALLDVEAVMAGERGGRRGLTSQKQYNTTSPISGNRYVKDHLRKPERNQIRLK